MAAITVRVGREEKEISGLSRRTTCSDIMQVLLKDRQTETNFSTENGDDAELVVTDLKSLKDLAKNYVIIENWRGCEKPLPPRTRILAVWQAWGKEQCHVKFSLKKDRGSFYRDETSRSCRHLLNKIEPQSESIHFMQNLTEEQKRRIRRNMMQYKRAVSRQTKVVTDANNNNNNNGKLCHGEGLPECTTSVLEDQVSSARPKSIAAANIADTLSKEQFVDGVVTGPECLLYQDSRWKFIGSSFDNKEFNREHCTYRRPHHKRRSMMHEDSDGLSDQNVVLSPPRHRINHYPYCNKSRRTASKRQRRRSKHHRRSGRVLKSSRKPSKCNGVRYSTDDTTTTSTCTISDDSDIDLDSHSEGEDADDEKSVMAECGTLISRRRSPKFSASTLPYCSVPTSGSKAAATDSSSATTTCSETSNTSVATSSSETSSGADYFSESFFAKRAAAAAANLKSSEKSKSKSGISNGPAKLFKMVKGRSFTKPAYLIESFKKKRRASLATSKPSDSASAKRITSINRGNTTSDRLKKSFSSGDFKTSSEKADESLLKASSSNGRKFSDSGISSQDSRSSPNTVLPENSSIAKDAETQHCYQRLKQLILSQEQALQTKCGKVKATDAEIQLIESLVHKWRTQEHGKNYVQNTYLSGADDTEKETSSLSEDGSRRHLPSLSVHVPGWLNDCVDAAMLSDYAEACAKVVNTQINIEECKREFEIILQDMQDEVWRASSDANVINNDSNPLTASALGLVSKVDEEDSSCDESESSRLESLSIASVKTKRSSSLTPSSPEETAEGIVEIERTRTELEANLYLSLRLSTELEEVDERTTTSQNLLQSKGETLLNLVRELSQSEEGISPDLWEEYGELLMAYDAEFSLKRYLADCSYNATSGSTMSNNVSNCQEANPDSTLVNHEVEVGPLSPTTTNLHHALSPWLWCGHCKAELEQQRDHMMTRNTSLHFGNRHLQIPTRLSDLPLPAMATISEISSLSHRPGTHLFPMPPIPDYGSDCDIIESGKVQTQNLDLTSTIISTENAIPRGIILRHPSGKEQFSPNSEIISETLKDFISMNRPNSITNADDSGNASAGSTSSFTSTISDSASTDMSSRNGSCDGGSPRPPYFTIDSQETLQPSFGSGEPTNPNNGKSKFVGSMPQKNETDLLSQQQKLIRRNSGNRLRKNSLIQNSLGLIQTNNLFNSRATSFGKAQIRASSVPTNLSGMANQPQYDHHTQKKLTNYPTETPFTSINMKSKQLRNNSSFNFPLEAGVTASNLRSLPLAPRSSFEDNATLLGTVRRLSEQYAVEHGKRRNISLPKDNGNNYDNDSDTGLSSLHSADSSDILTYSETLV